MSDLTVSNVRFFVRPNDVVRLCVDEAVRAVRLSVRLFVLEAETSRDGWPRGPPLRLFRRHRAIESATEDGRTDREGETAGRVVVRRVGSGGDEVGWR